MVDQIEECFELDWTDGLPVVPPTRSRVDAMMGGRDPKQIIAVLDPSRAEATIENIAANAVMAGCKPEYFPVVLAAIRALASPEFGLDSVLTTIHSQCPMVIVNGPAIYNLEFNNDSNVLGAGTRANATVGRAVALAMRNVAGAKQGALNPKTLGHPGAFSYCIAENEALSPWSSLAADRGFGERTSTVTVVAADAPLCLAYLNGVSADGVIDTIANALPLAGTYTVGLGGEVWIVLSPEHAALCSDLTKDEVRARLYERSRRMLPAEIGTIGFGPRMRGIELTETHVERHVTRTVEQVQLVVAGGEVGGYSAVIFGSGRGVTAPIEWEA